MVTNVNLVSLSPIPNIIPNPATVPPPIMHLVAEQKPAQSE